MAAIRKSPGSDRGEDVAANTVPTPRSQSATTWFGGYAGAIDLTYNLLHLLRDGDNGTFCNCLEILAPATKRALNKTMWCEVCVREAQEVRRDA